MFNINKWYVLKYVNYNLAVFKVENGVISELTINSKNARYFPTNHINREDILDWIHNRSLPVTRDGVKKDLGDLTPFEYMLINKGLSLTDHYWFSDVESTDTWESVNCFDNVFRSTYDIDILREPLDLTDYSKFTPTSTLTGNLRKKWVIDKDGNRFLVKGNSGRSAQQSINEVFISEIHKKQHIFPYVQYKLALLNVKGYKVLGCASKCFVTQETDFVPAAYIVRGHKMLQLYDLYRFFIEESNKLGIRLDYLKNYIDYQIMIDFITTNLDRHLNNFGLMRLVSSGKYYLIASIFDSGNSLGSTLHYIPTSRGILNIKTQVGSFKEREIELLKYVKNRQLVDVKKLPTIQDLYTLLKKDPFIRESEIEKIQQLYQAKIDIFSDFQSGIDVWRPEYRYTGTQLDDIEDLFDV